MVSIIAPIEALAIDLGSIVVHCVKISLSIQDWSLERGVHGWLYVYGYNEIIVFSWV